jgi:hypothetical protein
VKRILERVDVVASTPNPTQIDYDRAEIARETIDAPARAKDAKAAAVAIRVASKPGKLLERWFDAFGSAFVVDVLGEATWLGEQVSHVPGKGNVYWVSARREERFDMIDDHAAAELVSRLSPEDVVRLDVNVPTFVGLIAIVRKTRGVVVDSSVAFPLRAAYALLDGDDRSIRQPGDLELWLKSSRRDELVAMFGDATSARVVSRIREAYEGRRPATFDVEMKILGLVGGETNARAIAEMIDYRPIAKRAADFYAAHPDLAPKALGSASKQAEVVLRVTKRKKGTKLPPFVTREALAMLPASEAEDLVAFFATDPNDAAWSARTKGLDLEAFFIEVATAWHALGANMRVKWPIHGLARVATLPCVHWLVPVARQWGEAGLRSGFELATEAFRRIALSDGEGAGVALLQLAALADSKHGPDDGIAGRAYTTLGSIARALRLRDDEIRWARFPSFGLTPFGRPGAGTGSLRGIAWSLGATLQPAFAKNTTLTKNVQKDIETFAQLEEHRFFDLMLSGKRIAIDVFRSACVEHPVRRHIASRLVWSIDGMLVRLAEDGTFETIDHARHVPLAGAEAWIPHPVDMTDRQRWAERFAEYEVVPLLEQLSRPVFVAPDPDATELSGWNGRRIDTGVLRGGDLPFMGSDVFLRWRSFIVETRNGVVERVRIFFRKPLAIGTLPRAEVSEICLALERATT